MKIAGLADQHISAAAHALRDEPEVGVIVFLVDRETGDFAVRTHGLCADEIQGNQDLIEQALGELRPVFAH